jgi:hypothetical protein
MCQGEQNYSLVLAKGTIDIKYDLFQYIFYNLNIILPVTINI